MWQQFTSLWQAFSKRAKRRKHSPLVDTIVTGSFLMVVVSAVSPMLDDRFYTDEIVRVVIQGAMALLVLILVLYIVAVRLMMLCQLWRKFRRRARRRARRLHQKLKRDKKQAEHTDRSKEATPITEDQPCEEGLPHARGKPHSNTKSD